MPPGTLAAGATRHDVALTSDIYRLQPVTVEGEREGSALPTMRSENVKNVVPTDVLGTMTEDNVSRYFTYRDRIGYTRLPYRSIAAGIRGRF